MKKKLCGLALALLTAITLSVPTLAVTPQEAQPSAQLLYDLGLFAGVGDNPDGSPQFALDRIPTRAESITMLVRLLGAEQEARSHTWSFPFTDVPNWARPYIGYAYHKGYAAGVSPTHFAANQTVTAAQHLSFLLRALGYQDEVDFTWSEPWPLTEHLTLTQGDYPNSEPFLRADIALLSHRALYVNCKNSTETLLERLLHLGVFSEKSVVIWDCEPVGFSKNYASFLFYPVAGSPTSFIHFKIDRATVNGLPCDTLQINTPEEVSSYLASIGYSSGGFGYVELSYDETAALKAATQFYTINNVQYPLLGFTFSYTGTQANGSKVSGTFTDYYYMDGYPE